MLAGALARTCASLVRELLGRTIITHFVEWCETPCPKVPGFALADTCFLFDCDGKPLSSAPKRPCNNIYVYLPHSLSDPLEADAQRRLRAFWSTTFWSNAHALECQMAAMALALRGRNIDRAFWSQGPGGVGQSLESHRVAAMFGPLHGFLDLNIYFDDSELRKQSENLVGKLVTTGQEAEDGRGGMTQDLRKKTYQRRPLAVPTSVCNRHKVGGAHWVETV